MKESVQMSDSVGSVTQTQAAVQVTGAGERARESKQQPVPVDKVQLSAEAQQALREAVETPEQTAREAGEGEMQSKRRLAEQEATRQAAAQAEAKTTTHVVA
jgi:hypothetical protein